MSYYFYPFETKPLPYSYGALEPFIDKETMEYHHDKHYLTYVTKLNAALDNFPEIQKMSLEQLLYSEEKIPFPIKTAVKNNAGGVYNHLMFFDAMSNKVEPFGGSLMRAIIRDFTSYENFKQQFKAQALSVFGSGYVWLISVGGKLKIVTTANQDTPIKIGVPILLLDVWEHAYYLKHKNQRDKYIDDFFNVINLKMAEENYVNAIHNM